MQIELAPLERKERYKLIAGFIVPRPIALVTTRNAAGLDNAAPFSAFNYMSEDPPIVALGLQVHPDESPKAGQPKDTTRNIHDNGEFVVNLVDEALAEAMNICSIDFPPDESEIAAAGLTLAPSIAIQPKRIVEAPIAMECRRLTTLEFGSFRSIVLGEILWMHVRDGLVDPKTLRVSEDAWRPVGRIFGSLYTRTNDRFEMRRLPYEEWRRKTRAAAKP